MYRARQARRDDHPAFERFWAQLGLEQRPFDIDVWDERYREHTTFLEGPGGELVGYALAVPLGGRGDVRQIVVDPAWRGRGIGRELMRVVASKLRDAGCRNWRLEVRADNVPAIALYRRVGMAVLHELFTLRLARGDAERFAATRSGRLRVELVDPSEERELEQCFDLGEGQLARCRATRPSGVMWRIGRVALAHYTRDFQPAFGLVFPFRAPDADHAAHLVAEACALGGMLDEIETMIPDRPVADALRAAGARVTDHLLEMGGPL